MLWFMLAFFLAAFGLYFWRGMRQSIHMMQLNGYYIERFLRWMKGQDRKESNYLLIGTLVSGMILRDRIPISLYYFLHGALFLALFLLRKKNPEKKPLVYTWRIRRLLVTAGLVSVLFVALLGLLFSATFRWELPVIFAFLNLLSQTVTVAANLINRPMENIIARRFTLDAKRMLAEHPGLKIVGITGSYGKTSTKQLLCQLLAPDFEVLATPESYNTPMGVVRTIRENLNAAHQIFLVEMGAKKVGDVKEICGIVKPSMGILTAIGEMHLETFRSLDNIIRTKFELAEAVGAEGLMLLNEDNEYIRGRATAQPALRYGLGGADEERKPDVWAENIRSGPEGSQFDLYLADGSCVACRTRLLGSHNVLNITAAAAAAVSLGLAPGKLAGRISRLAPVEHRLRLLAPGPLFQIIDDAFNANPEGARQALETLGTFPGFRVLITPGIVELGRKEEELNQELGRQAATHCDFIIIAGRDARGLAIIGGTKLAEFAQNKIYVATDIHDALAKAEELARNLPPEAGPMTLLLENDLPDNYL